jgi:hypothetical protein
VRRRVADRRLGQQRHRDSGSSGACLRWLWSARPSDQTMASQSSAATGHPTLFGTLAQPSLDIFRLCLWRTADSPTSGNQSSNRPLCAARSRVRWIFTYEESQAEGVDLAHASLAEGEKTEGKHVNEPPGVQPSPRAGHCIKHAPTLRRQLYSWASAFEWAVLLEWVACSLSYSVAHRQNRAQNTIVKYLW